MKNMEYNKNKKNTSCGIVWFNQLCLSRRRIQFLVIYWGGSTFFRAS